MRVYRVSGKENKLFFTNYKRISEDLIFDKIKEILSSNSSILMGDKTIRPSEDIYKCKLEDLDFDLVYDVDYGGSIYSESKEVINKLENILNKE